SVALLWENGQMYNLADLLPAGSSWTELYDAVAISDNGWIAGILTSTAYNTDWFVMIPTGEERPPSIGIGDVTVTEGNSGTRAASFTVTLSAGSSQSVSVAYATASGSASAGSDYQAVSDMLTFAPRATSKTITVHGIGDRLAEPKETFVFNLSSPTNATIADGHG